MKKRKIITIGFFTMLFMFSCITIFARNNKLKQEESKIEEKVNMIVNDNKNTEKEDENEKNQEETLENDTIRGNNYT